MTATESIRAPIDLPMNLIRVQKFANATLVRGEDLDKANRIQFYLPSFVENQDTSKFKMKITRGQSGEYGWIYSTDSYACISKSR